MKSSIFALTDLALAMMLSIVGLPVIPIPPMVEAEDDEPRTPTGSGW